MPRRRSLMLAAAGGGLSLPALASSSQSSPASDPSAVLPEASSPPSTSGLPSQAAFQALVGEQFTSSVGAVQLDEVKSCFAAETQFEQFTLVLKGKPALVSGLYELHHPSTGTLLLRLEAQNPQAHDGNVRADICR